MTSDLSCFASINKLLAAGSISNGQVALLAVVAVLTALTLLAGARRRRDGGPSPKAYAREQVARIKEERAVQAEVTDVMLQLEQLAKEVNAQLDTKFVKLERVIADADDRIARLERLLRQATGSPTIDTTVDDSGDVHGRVADPNRDSWRERALQLHHEGRSASQIARLLDRSVGEVELLVALPRTDEKIVPRR